MKIIASGRTDLEDYFRLSGIREYKDLAHTPFLIFAMPAKYPNNVSYRTKFGGKPDLIQPTGDDGRSCNVCGQALHFIRQIDSFENDHPDPQFMFADVGMIYVWFCFKCGEPVAHLESY